MKAVIVETGEDSDRYIVLVGSSLAIAIAGVKRIFGDPYIVRWEDHDGDIKSPLIGHFEPVAGYSTRHCGQFEFTEYDVVD